ncbi:MAG: hypothetical protein Q7T82_13200, partial [Armatimonadota bacterium]|nr:hypothetical protein [Armatimonadota bacterium]
PHQLRSWSPSEPETGGKASRPLTTLTGCISRLRSHGKTKHTTQQRGPQKEQLGEPETDPGSAQLG